MAVKELKQPVLCRGCGRELLGTEAFPEDSYCKIYGCCCCPHKKASPCQKETREGTLLEFLARY
jgi:hypothetical protein